MIHVHVSIRIEVLVLTNGKIIIIIYTLQHNADTWVTFNH